MVVFVIISSVPPLGDGYCALTKIEIPVCIIASSTYTQYKLSSTCIILQHYSYSCMHATNTIQLKVLVPVLYII